MKIYAELSTADYSFIERNISRLKSDILGMVKAI